MELSLEPYHALRLQCIAYGQLLRSEPCSPDGISNLFGYDYIGGTSPNAERLRDSPLKFPRSATAPGAKRVVYLLFWTRLERRPTGISQCPG